MFCFSLAGQVAAGSGCRVGFDHAFRKEYQAGEQAVESSQQQKHDGDRKHFFASSSVDRDSDTASCRCDVDPRQLDTNSIECCEFSSTAAAILPKYSVSPAGRPTPMTTRS